MVDLTSVLHFQPLFNIHLRYTFGIFPSSSQNLYVYRPPKVLLIDHLAYMFIAQARHRERVRSWKLFTGHTVGAVRMGLNLGPDDIVQEVHVLEVVGPDSPHHVLPGAPENVTELFGLASPHAP